MQTTTIENVWTRSKFFIKCITIGVLTLLLLIPVFSVQNLVEEREARQREAVTEVSSKWAGAQTVAGPVLAVPYLATDADTAGNTALTKHTAYFLPDELDVTAKVTPQERSRGIYKVILYTSDLQLSGSFATLPFDQLQIPADKVLWNEAYLKMNIADTKGLNDELKLTWNDSAVILMPQRFSNAPEGMTAPVALPAPGNFKKISFRTNLSLNGSQKLAFTPVGKITNVHLNAAWPHPSFTGNTLPQTTNISADSFSASWKSLAHKQPFAQYWTDGAFSNAQLRDAAFGVDLFIPVNDYQKTLRAVKYAALCIVLTFAAFFLIDTAHKKNVHPFQYGLIGLALIVFYMLLLSISEYTGFNTAYAIAALATIVLIGWFIKGVLASGRLSGILTMLLVVVYAYVFTILQLQDFALLLGSIGLFLSLAAIMYFSKKWSW